MGKNPRDELNMRRSWNAEEDKILSDYIRTHGNTGWRSLPQKAGLNRCGKSCRLRWLNYLRPDIKRGHISADEEELIVRMHRLLGNRWSLIAGRLPGRTDNEIKNYWNTRLSKRIAEGKCTSFPVTKEESVPKADGAARPCEMRSIGEEKKTLDASSIQLKNGHLQLQPEGGSQDSLESITSTFVGIPYTLDCNLFSMPCTDFPMGDLLPLIPLDLLYDNFII